MHENGGILKWTCTDLIFLKNNDGWMMETSHERRMETSHEMPSSSRP